MSSKRNSLRIWLVVLSVCALVIPALPAQAADNATDITSQVLADGNILLAGDSTINLPSGTTTYTGVFSGTGTLTVAGSGTLVLTKDSDVTLPAASRHQSVTTSGGSWPYPIVSDPDPPTVIVKGGATLQYGDGGAAGIIGNYPYSWPNINLTLNEDNIQVDGTLLLDISNRDYNLGTISGSGLISQPRNTWGTLDLEGPQPFTGVIGDGTGMNIGDASYRVALPEAKAILNDGSAIISARNYTLAIPQNIYEQNYGTDVNFHTWQAGLIVMTGVYDYSDSGADADPALSNPALNTAEVPHTVNFRGVNIEGADVQWGDGTTDRFFLPAVPSDSYINIHSNGKLAFDYDGPVTLDTPISGGVYHDSLSTPAYADITLDPTRGNAVTYATAQNYHGTTSIGAGATLLLGTGSPGGDGSVLTGTSSDAIVDDGALAVRNTATPVTLSQITGSGSLIQSGTATTKLTGTTAYTGPTGIMAGTLALGAGSGGIAASSGVTLTGGALDLSAAGSQTIRDLTGAAGTTVVLGAHPLTVGATDSTTYGGTISGGGGLTKTGSGTLTLTGAVRTAGPWQIDQGTLALNSAGVGNAFIIGGLTQAAGSTLALTVGGDQLALTVDGPVSLAGTLKLDPASAVAADRQVTLLRQTGTEPVTGAFAGLPQGAKLTVGAAVFQISYTGGTGHDIVLTAVTGGPTAGSSGASGILAQPTARTTSDSGFPLPLAALGALLVLAALLLVFTVVRRRRTAESGPGGRAAAANLRVDDPARHRSRRRRPRDRWTR